LCHLIPYNELARIVYDGSSRNGGVARDKREDRLVSLVYLVCLVCLVEPDRPDRPDEPDQPSRLARPASLALHAPLSVALADFFNILLNPVLVKFDSIDQS
jgi:hypothetical protein